MKKRLLVISLLALAALLFAACGDDAEPAGQTFTSNDTPMDVPGGGAYVDSIITVSGAPTSISKIIVTVTVPHTQTGRLFLYLYGPSYAGSGTNGVINLATMEGDSGVVAGYLYVKFDDDADESIFNATMPPGGFVSRYRPYEPLSEFYGTDANGDWTFSVAEIGSSSVNGQIESWSITFE